MDFHTRQSKNWQTVLIGWLTSQATYTVFWLVHTKRVVYPRNTRHQPMYTEYNFNTTVHGNFSRYLWIIFNEKGQNWYRNGNLKTYRWRIFRGGVARSSLRLGSSIPPCSVIRYASVHNSSQKNITRH